MTNREFYQSIINGEINDEITTKATELLTALDARNEKRKSTESKEKKEVSERRNTIVAYLTERKGECFTRDQIAFDLDMIPTKVSGACKALVDEGVITKSEIKVDKARKVAYSIA